MQSSHLAPPADRAPSEREPRDGFAIGLLVLALLLGLVRFWRLGEWSLWYDEAATWFDLQASLANPELHNKLGYSAIGALVRLLGGEPTEFNLRLLPAIAGWLVIPATWFAFRPVADARRAAAAALLVAASSWHVYWSQNARFYTLAQLTALVGGGLVLRALWNSRLWQALAGCALVALAGLFHPSAVVLLPALCLAPWLLSPLRLPELENSRRVRAALLALLGAGALLGCAWAWRTWQTYLHRAPDSSTVHYLLTTGFYVTPLLGAAAFFGIFAAWVRRAAFGLIAALVVVLGLCAMLLCSLQVVVSAQYVFVLLPWIAILAAWPLAHPPERSRRGDAIAACWLALLVLPALASTLLYFGPRAGERPPWREAYDYVWNQRESGDLVLGMEAPVGEYYLDPQSTDLATPQRVPWLDRWRTQRPREWATHARRAWYVFNPEQMKGWEPQDAREFERFLRERCRLVKCFPLYVETRDLSVWVYLRG
ncbi:MAG: glycosyltransferase family 39 protein [Planctomycetes bacterium]|nr:glycosyltransferase family 39 protein [Planctomycetota bacterium]